MLLPGNERPEFQSKYFAEPFDSRRRLRPAKPVAPAEFPALRHEEVEVTRIYHHWKLPCRHRFASARKAHVCQGISLQGVVRDSNPILADLPEVAMKFATDS